MLHTHEDDSVTFVGDPHDLQEASQSVGNMIYMARGSIDIGASVDQNTEDLNNFHNTQEDEEESSHDQEESYEDDDQSENSEEEDEDSMESGDESQESSEEESIKKREPPVLV